MFSSKLSNFEKNPKMPKRIYKKNQKKSKNLKIVKYLKKITEEKTQEKPKNL